ncbi:MAG: hypothetical protein KDC35_16895 [Acidobacteria bacterium]|nr:hypothetical protein [Acidobacteriota bacterium]
MMGVFKRRRFWVVLACVLLFTPIALYLLLTPFGLWGGNFSSYVQTRRGVIKEVYEDRPPLRAETSETRYLKIQSTSGLVVRIAIRSPRNRDGDSMPLVVLLGGLTRGRSAVELVGHPTDLVFVAVDYPSYGDIRLDGADYPFQMRTLIRSLYDTVPALLLVLDYLDSNAQLPQQTELVGVSLGAPIACAAAAQDQRFSRLWSVHGGADIEAMLNQAGHRVKPEWLRESLSKGLKHLLRHLEPANHVGRVSPRPFVMINGTRDALIPKPCIDKLYQSANFPKEIIWTETGHVQEKKEAVIRQLIEIVVTRISQNQDQLSK